MFTGIVQAKCELLNIEESPGLKTFEVAMTQALVQGLVPGASVANNGVCLTVTKVLNDKVFFDVMEETLTLTNLAHLSVSDNINIERSLTFGSEIGGHILSGHVHCQARVSAISHTDTHYNIEVSLDAKWMNYIFYKGFVGVNGCSLTVGAVNKTGFILHLIPETLALTNLSELVVGDFINIEIDSQTQVIVDTVERVLAQRGLV
ncbi:riboflavin synthase subunit alpha [Shewanella sp. SR44-3]|uniref:riboflavin synthase subunit alpha n=1 Tax=unclassified Shewanella TaxID=196818 RepID=UPI0015F85A06|nr:riboflavin synthase subunit alpha [Shewanella sp. SR44-3]MBB1267902.1 riboflavin synthase subunit alpha [Shewanella sp. SR44-3]